MSYHKALPDDKNHGKLTRDPIEIIRDIEQGGELLMNALTELIEWSDFDVSQINDYLKRLEKFLEAIIEAHPKIFTLSELTEKLALDEATLRRLLRGVGVEVNPHISNPEETVTERDLIPLLADRAGSRVGDRLAELLRGDGPYVSWV